MPSRVRGQASRARARKWKALLLATTAAPTSVQAVGATAAKAITEIFGTPATENERGWLTELREASDNSDPRLTARSRTALRAIFGK